MKLKKAILLALVTVMVLTMSSIALAQQADEWGQYQKDVGHPGTINIDVPVTNKVIRRTDNIGAREGSEPMVAGNRGYVYCGVGGTSGAIYCYNLSTGAEIWHTAVGAVSAWESWSSPAVYENVVYIGSGTLVSALDAFTGKVLWTKDLNTIKANANIVNSSPAVDGKYLIIGDTGNACYYCLDVTNKGALLWTFNLDAGCMASSTACISNGMVFVGQATSAAPWSGKVWCINETTGKAVTTWGTGGAFPIAGKVMTGSVTAAGDFIYFTDFAYATAPAQCYLYCLGRATGVEAWKAPVFGSNGAPSVASGLVVTAGLQTAVWPDPGTNWVTAFSCDTDNGKSPVQLWSKSGMGGDQMSACIANGKVAVGNGISGWPPVTGTDVWVLEAADGKTVWHSTEAGGPPVATAYGLLSVGDGKMITFGSGSLPNGAYYFAEGTTRTGYQEWICLENPTGATVNASIEYIMGDGATSKQDVALPKQSRTTVDVNLFLGPGRDVSAHVTGNGYFVAERSMYFESGGLNGGEQVMGVSDPSLHAMFAEGTTREGFKTWLAIQNPQASDTNVLITYLYADGSVPVQQNVRVGALTRQTIDVNAGAGENKDMSIAVTSTRPVVSERVMYFKYPQAISGSRPSGVHNSTGAAAAQTSWYFAEGATYSNFAEYLCLMNPRGVDTTATITYMMGTGSVETVTKALKANSRTTVNVTEDVGPNQDVSALVSCPDPIVAERPMYFQYTPIELSSGSAGGMGMWKGGHNAVGAVYTAYKWEFAEGCTRDGFQTFLCIANPNDVQTTADITYYIYKTDGTSEAIKDVSTIAAHSRRTILVNQVIGNGADVSMTVASNVPLVVERPMYFSFSGYTDGGDSLGLPGAL
ncbi:MAG: DUF5719 family protein [Candidatus Geothermincolia bacterium]